MAIFDVWLEGYVTNGDRSKATFMGRQDGEDFDDACLRATVKKGWDMSYYKSGNPPTYWACRYYDNETDARKVFG